MYKFELGQKVQDKLSGFIGYITGRAEYSIRPVSYLVSKKGSNEENELPKEMWFFENALIEVKE